MPLLGIFSKKSSKASTASNAGHSVSHVSLDEEDYVSVTSPNNKQAPTSTSKLGLPLRRRPAQDKQSQHLTYLDPLLEPPPRRSSLFQNYQDDSTTQRSTQSLPDGDRRPSRPEAQPHQVSENASTDITPKKSMFSWRSSKKRSKSAPSVKPPPPDDSSFNLKSFRHVRPESPSPFRASPSSLPPIPVPTPTTAMPSPPVSFQVTSRRPRGNSVSDLPPSASQITAASQQKMAAGAFRQAARRSSASLTLTDSPVISPTASPACSPLDDRPPPSLLPPASGRGTPSRVTEPLRLSGISSTSSTFHAPAPKPAPRKHANAFGLSSSSSSSEEEEDANSDSTDDGAGLTRQATIKPHAAELPPLNAAVRQQIQRAMTPVSASPPRAQSSLGVYGAGVRQRASQSVGALSPSAKEARASVAIVANARTVNPTRPPPKPSPASMYITKSTSVGTTNRAPGSDTSESESAADADSDEDAPLSSLVPPRRPGTAMSTHSSPTASRKPLVDLESPSTMTGRPVRAPPPMAREEENPRSKARTAMDFPSRAGTQRSLGSKASPDSPASSRLSQAPSSSRNSLTHSPEPKVSAPKSLSPPQSFRVSQISQQSSQSLEGRLEALPTPSRTNISSSPVAPPMRPFARRESPASSTGDSSSGKAPLTPRDGSDLGGGTRSTLTGSASRSRQGHGQKPSVTFDDEQKSERKGKSRERDTEEPQAARLRERRRNEARAAIELGNVVNGPPPVDEDDIALRHHQGMQAGGWQQPGTPFPMPPIPPIYGMNMSMSVPSPGTYGFGALPPTADPAFLAAHQQAMAIAKQTFQYAVAQQALAAANEEWERTSNAGAHWGGSQWGGSPYGFGMGMGMRTSAMFPSAPRSMYAGNVGEGGAGGGAPWGGARSVYGEPFGPARQSVYPQSDLPQQRPPRQRTKTAPSGVAPGTGIGRMPAPPSSFRGVGR